MLRLFPVPMIAGGPRGPTKSDRAPDDSMSGVPVAVEVD